MRFARTMVLSVFILFFLASEVWSSEVRSQLVQESTLEQIMRRGVMKVGMSTFVPWAMQDKDGEFIGFEVDVAKRLAEDIGVDVHFIPTKWSGIIPALLTGKFDIIIGGMGIKPDRNIKVNFSIPYDYTGMSIVAHQEKARGFSTLEDFNKSDVTVAARLGTTAAAAASDYLPQASLKLFDDEAQAVQELLNGRVHAVIASAPLPAFQALLHPEKLFVPLEENFTREPIGFAVRKGDFDTINFLDNWIRFVRSQGWLEQRKHYWFETRDWEDRIK
ncbi:MAG: transporter substrate-binding domain-containing protein [Desulfonatronovibrio sp.]